MYCTRCGKKIADDVNYCADCGAATANIPRPFDRRLTRSREDVKIAGVCAGFAAYLGVDVTLVRILWVILTIFSVGVGLVVYIACWILMPKAVLMLPAASMNPAQSHG